MYLGRQSSAQFEQEYAHAFIIVAHYTMRDIRSPCVALESPPHQRTVNLRGHRTAHKQHRL
ncbi:hypothetical protein BM1_07471 [Bipolaris maydis]|nr:hypothetical protein BM1_07471 [Bipolaris maydis]